WCAMLPGSGVRIRPSPTIANIYSKGAVEFTSSATVGRVRAEGDLRVTGCSPSWTSATYGGSFANNPGCSRSAARSTQAVELTPVPPVEVDLGWFDANA